jgi:hypothetical protein
MRRCECGALAAKMTQSGPACQRCLDIEARMDEYHKPAGHARTEREAEEADRVRRTGYILDGRLEREARREQEEAGYRSLAGPNGIGIHDAL